MATVGNKKRKHKLIKRKSVHRHIPIHDIKEPNLFRRTFPYRDVPQIEFGGQLAPMNLPHEIFITDTTFRDGQQARPPYHPEQVLQLFEMMHRLGGPNGLIRQSEFFLYSDRDKRAVELCLEKGYQFPEVTGWIRARVEDFELVKNFGLKETGILTSVSDYHIFLKLKRNRRRCLNDYLKVVEAALTEGIVPRCHFEDVTRADIYGFVVPFAIELMRLREESGIDIKIRLCDTMGYGVPYPGATLPRSVPQLVHTMIHEAGVPSHLLEWHGHNDFHKVLVNAATAWLYGCAAANGTLAGFGERTGNPPIEGMIVEYLGLVGGDESVDTCVITEIANYIEEIGTKIPPNYPFIGARFNATSAGVHLDGMAKNEEIYNIFDTERILNRPPGILINDKSGTAGIAQWVNSHLRLTGRRRVDKRNPGVAKVNRWIKKQFESGRVTNISDEELDRMAQRYLPGYFVSDFERIKHHAFDMAAQLVEELSQNPEVRSMKPARQAKLLVQFLSNNPFIQFAQVTDLHGHKITPDVFQPEDYPIFENSLTDIDYSDRPWHIGPLRDGRIHVTEPYTSIITGLLICTISAPVLDRDDVPQGVVAVHIKFSDITTVEEAPVHEEISYVREQLDRDKFREMAEATLDHERRSQQERREGRERRSGTERRSVKQKVKKELRTGSDRRIGKDRRKDGNQRKKKGNNG
ncbi:MAG: hypothetical protein P9M14_02820 [Candidatus Alcyoniella australis]|nr:hypothetical protein [Candidatus Alcyoniella australis]